MEDKANQDSNLEGNTQTTERSTRRRINPENEGPATQGYTMFERESSGSNPTAPEIDGGPIAHHMQFSSFLFTMGSMLEAGPGQLRPRLSLWRVKRLARGEGHFAAVPSNQQPPLLSTRGHFLALEERNSGLTEEFILGNMTRHPYKPMSGGSEAEEGRCCICQDNYSAGDDIGFLDCRHYNHFNCIKDWLTLKNLCPVCKARGLDG